MQAWPLTWILHNNGSLDVWVLAGQSFIRSHDGLRRVPQDGSGAVATSNCQGELVTNHTAGPQTSSEGVSREPGRGSRATKLRYTCSIIGRRMRCISRAILPWLIGTYSHKAFLAKYHPAPGLPGTPHHSACAARLRSPWKAAPNSVQRTGEEGKDPSRTIGVVSISLRKRRRTDMVRAKAILSASLFLPGAPQQLPFWD